MGGVNPYMAILGGFWGNWARVENLRYSAEPSGGILNSEAQDTPQVKHTHIRYERAGGGGGVQGI